MSPRAKTALVLDKNPLALMARMATRCGYDVHTATDGDDAVARLNRTRYTVIVLDADYFPVLLSCLKAASGDTPILVVGTDIQDASDPLPKPFTTADFCAALTRATTD